MGFSATLQALIQEKKISQSELSRQIGVTRASVNDWLKRGVIPDGKSLARISDYFGCSVASLLGSSSGPSKVEVSFTKSNRQLILEELDGNPELEAAVLAVIKAMKAGG